MCPHDPIYFIFCLYYSFSNTKNNIHLTTITYITLSLMSMMSKTEMYLIFLTSLMMTNNFCIESNSRLDHLLFRFSLQRMFKVVVFGNFGKYKENKKIYIYISTLCIYQLSIHTYIYIYIYISIYHIYIYLYIYIYQLHSFYHISRYILVDKKVTIKKL